MKLIIKTTRVSLLIIFISACANNSTIKKPKGISSQFNTNISESGLKIFSLKAKTQQALPVRRTSIDTKQTKKQLTRWLEQELAAQLSASGFCETGHTEIERSIGIGFAIIRGECNELAPS